MSAEETASHPGVIRGIVVDAETGNAIAGAYVGVGEFGDSGGSNRSRHRKEGLSAKSETDSQGKFTLDGLVLTEGHRYVKAHPLVVTHDDYVRADVKVELSAEKHDVDVKVRLTKGAKIDVTVVDSKGKPVEGYWILRLEDLSGRRFLAPGQDPHMGAFASSVWTKNPDLRTSRNMGRSTGCLFNALAAGQYRVEAIRLRILPNPSLTAIWDQPWRYHGEVAKLAVRTGQATAIEIPPIDYGTSLTVKTHAQPFTGLRKLEQAPKDFLKGEQIRGILNISRNTGLRAWDMGRVYHVEDARLGRIQKKAMFFAMVAPGESFTIENLPPGRYAVFSMANVKVVIVISSAAVEVARGRDIEVEMAQPVIDGIGEVGVHTLDGRLELAEGQYRLKELCRLISARTKCSPELVPDPAIENDVVAVEGGEIVLWDLLERLCAESQFALKEMERKKLGIALR